MIRSSFLIHLLTVMKDEMTAQQVTKLEQNKLNDLDRAAQTQLDYNDSVSDGSLTVREILELEKKGTTTVD